MSLVTIKPPEIAEQLGHDQLEWDPPGLSSAQRWTCARCGRAVIRVGLTVYGEASHELCHRRSHMSLPTVEAVTEALGAWFADEEWFPREAGAVLAEAARAYVNAVEFTAPHTVDVPGHYLLIKVRSK